MFDSLINKLPNYRIVNWSGIIVIIYTLAVMSNVFGIHKKGRKFIMSHAYFILSMWVAEINSA
jgi:hypothetical protein